MMDLATENKRIIDYVSAPNIKIAFKRYVEKVKQFSLLVYFSRPNLDIDAFSNPPDDLLDFILPPDHTELTRYWVSEPFAAISILHDTIEKKDVYMVQEPSLTAFEKTLLERIYDDLQDVLSLDDAKTDSFSLTTDSRSRILKIKTLNLINAYSIAIDDSTIYKILYYIERNYIGFGAIDGIMHDPYIEDISCNGTGIPLFVYHMNYHNIETTVKFSEGILNSFVLKLAQRGNKQLTVGTPMADATLEDGSRLQASLGTEVTTRGSSFTIRKFKDSPYTPTDLIKFHTCDIGMLAYLWLVVENNKSMIFAGGTASGKTTFLNAISLFIPPSSKVVTIEDTRELTLHHDNWVADVTRDSITSQGDIGSIDMYDLLRSALRQRPEYILLGEVRGPEAITLFQAMSTGHTTYATMHASDVQNAVNRLESEPINVPHNMLIALDLISIQAQVTFMGARVRRTTQIVELAGIDPRTGNIRINEIFTWDPTTDQFQRSGDSFIMGTIMKQRGWNSQKIKSELENRKKILEVMVRNDVNDYKEFTSIIHQYFTDPETLLKTLK